MQTSCLSNQLASCTILIAVILALNRSLRSVGVRVKQSLWGSWASMSQSPIESLLASYGFDKDWHMDMIYFRHVFVNNKYWKYTKGWNIIILLSYLCCCFEVDCKFHSLLCSGVPCSVCESTTKPLLSRLGFCVAAFSASCSGGACCCDDGGGVCRCAYADLVVFPPFLSVLDEWLLVLDSWPGIWLSALSCPCHDGHCCCWRPLHLTSLSCWSTVACCSSVVTF